MDLDFESAQRLFTEGKLVHLIERSGRTEAERLSLEPHARALVAEALAEVGNLDEALRLVNTESHTSLSASVCSQMEWVRGLVDWRRGVFTSAIDHARSALRFALETSDRHQIVWAHLHLFRLVVLTEPVDAIRVMLSDVRRIVNCAGSVQACTGHCLSP